MRLREHGTLTCWNGKASATRDWSISALQVDDHLKRFHRVIGQHFTVGPFTEDLNSNRGLDPASICIVQMSELTKLSRNVLRSLGPDDPCSRNVVTPDASGPQIFVSTPRALCCYAVVDAAWEAGGLGVFLGHFDDRFSSLAGEKCWGTGYCSTSASRKERPQNAFSSRKIYHVTTTWPLTSSTGGFFSLPHPLLVQAVWMPSRDQVHYSDFLWNLIL